MSQEEKNFETIAVRQQTQRSHNREHGQVPKNLTKTYNRERNWVS